MTKKTHDETNRLCLTKDDSTRMQAEWDLAHDFDPRDPLFGLKTKDMQGPAMPRRTVLRLLAASGALTLAHLAPGIGGISKAHARGRYIAGWLGGCWRVSNA